MRWPRKACAVRKSWCAAPFPRFAVQWQNAFPNFYFLRSRNSWGVGGGWYFRVLSLFLLCRFRLQFCFFLWNHYILQHNKAAAECRVAIRCICGTGKTLWFRSTSATRFSRIRSDCVEDDDGDTRKKNPPRSVYCNMRDCGGRVFSPLNVGSIATLQLCI